MHFTFQDFEGYGFDGHIFSVSFLQSFFFFCRDAILKVASRNSLRSEARRRLKNQRREIASIVEFCRNNPQAHLWLDPVLSRRLWTRTARNLLPPFSLVTSDWSEPFSLQEAGVQEAEDAEVFHLEAKNEVCIQKVLVLGPHFMWFNLWYFCLHRSKHQVLVMEKLLPPRQRIRRSVCK